MDRFRNEDGFAMITALLVSMVVLSLSVVVISVAVHNSGSSGYDRDRLDAVSAAEAGLDLTQSTLNVTAGNLPCSLTGTMNGAPTASYTTTITYYSAWPPTTASQLNCAAQPFATEPLGAVMHSTGSSRINDQPVTRYMESAVQLTPRYKGFGQAIFSHNLLNFQNKLTINGNTANDADVYTNGNFSMGNNTVIAGSVYAQGTVSINQGVVKQDVWGNQAVDLHNLTVQGSVTSSKSSVSLATVTVAGNGTACTTVSLSNNSTIAGNKIQGKCQPAPPQLPLPQVGWTPNDWGAPAANVLTMPSCTAAKTWLSKWGQVGGAVAGNYVLTVSPQCTALDGTLLWGNNSTINLYGNLVIYVYGSLAQQSGKYLGAFVTQNQTNWNGVGGKWNLYVIRPYTASLCANLSSPTPNDFTVSNNTSFNNLNVFFYSQCSINFGNNNAGGFNGQIIGGQVNITNQMVMNYVPLVIPKQNRVGYTSATSYIREVSQ